ncbi:MAG: ABC transporter substrate-binding protein, partial [Mobilitalea sp.]
MKRKLLSVLLMVVMVASLMGGCSKASTKDDTKKIGVAMPTKDLQRWNQDGSNMKTALETAGYTVDL